ncbi:MAG TPA: hypothetical protein ENK43_05595 [Planctomycetes bacterium]|nr:hypothetical protein [Planctomycetota bacterium]
MRIPTLALCFFVLAATAASQTTAEAWMPADTPNQGSTVSSPFGTSLSSGQNSSHTIVQQIPASYLMAAGIPANALLTDVALAPNGGGTITIPNFHAAVGLSPAPWNNSLFLGNILLPEDIWNSGSQGTFTWTVQANQWNTLNPTPLTQTVWDGVSDLALYISTGNLQVQPAGSGMGGPILIWLGTFRSASGVSLRNRAPGFAAPVPTVTDTSGLKVRLTFNTGPGQQPGTVTFLGPPNVTPGTSRVVVFSAPGHAGELYVPVVSCTLGSTIVPGLPAPLPIVNDACTSFYFNDPLSPFIFALALPALGPTFGLLDAQGMSTGVVASPANIVPPGLGLDVHITFVTLDLTGLPTGVHGIGTITFL